MASQLESRGRYFDEFQVGDTVVSPGRTITEADIVNFAGLTGDFTQLHTNAEAARQGVFGQRVAHGLLGLSVASGLLTQTGFIQDTILAFHDLEWKFSLPIFIGDTIHATALVGELKPMRRLGGGVVTLEIEVINQAGKRVQSGKWATLIAARP